MEPGIRSSVMSGADESVHMVKLPRRLGMGLLVLLGTQVLLMAAVIGALASRIHLVERIRSGEVVAASEAGSADNAVATIGGIEAWIWIATFVVWILWQFRAQRAVRELSLVSRFRFTPGWVIGWWFIPIANLWMPFETIRELWKASEGRPDWPSIPTWSIVGWWWAVSLVSVVAYNIAAALTDQATTPDGVITRDEWLIAALVIGVASSVLAIAVVRAVRRRQDIGAERHSSMMRHAPAHVPPPP